MRHVVKLCNFKLFVNLSNMNLFYSPATPLQKRLIVKLKQVLERTIGFCISEFEYIDKR